MGAHCGAGEFRIGRRCLLIRDSKKVWMSSTSDLATLALSERSQNLTTLHQTTAGTYELPATMLLGSCAGATSSKRPKKLSQRNARYSTSAVAQISSQAKQPSPRQLNLNFWALISFKWSFGSLCLESPMSFQSY